MIIEVMGNVANESSGTCAVVLMDNKMKFEAIRPRKKSSELYGKKGMSWHGCVVFYEWDRQMVTGCRDGMNLQHRNCPQRFLITPWGMILSKFLPRRAPSLMKFWPVSSMRFRNYNICGLFAKILLVIRTTSSR